MQATFKTRKLAEHMGQLWYGGKEKVCDVYGKR
jgi:hypothetical protein